MYEPESSVPSPVMPFWSMRGFTTQNCVSLRIKCAPSLSILAVSSTPFWSGCKRILTTRPTSTFSIRMVVVFTSMPSALSIYSLISVPRERKLSINK